MLTFKSICVTGANGFIGKSICKVLIESNKPVRGIVRNVNLTSNSKHMKYVPVGDIGYKSNFKNALVDVDCIIHCAGKTHTINEEKADALKIYRSVNVEGTKQLAEQAVKAGVKRLIFLSSIKVNGEHTNNKCSDESLNSSKKKFMHNDIPNNKDPYAVSKLEAEKVLWEISSKTGLEVIVVRLPLVYGKDVKGNLERLIKLVRSGIPLPLSLVQNQRSMIGMDNLIDLLIRCIDHPDAAGKTFLVSDDKDLSTPSLIKYIATSMGCRARLFPVPIFMLKILGYILGKQKEINRLVGFLKIDISYTKEILNWTPPVSVAEGIRRMVKTNDTYF
jgi:nucleoside-diphosphate-sugar epimerase